MSTLDLNLSSVDADFDRKKNKILQDLLIPEETDLSPKGSVDVPILPIMNVINSNPDYVTTSSCSGRIALYCDPIPTKGIFENEFVNAGCGEDLTETLPSTPKGGGHWMFVTHDPISSDIINSADFNVVELLFPGAELSFELSHSSDSSPEAYRLIWYKFEPMVLHVQARNVAKGKEFLELSFGQGFRNSGMVLSNKGRSMVGVRSSAKLVVPIARLASMEPKPRIELLVSLPYLLLLLRLGNQKFKQNFEQMDRYRKALEEKLSGPLTDSFSTMTKSCLSLKETKEERRRRKKAEGLKRQLELRQEPAFNFS